MEDGNRLRIAIVVAIAQNGVIGFDGDMPWRLSSDLKRFKQITLGKAIIMGRKTFESIGKALPGRLNIVVTRSGFEAEGTASVPDLNSAVDMARDWTRENNVKEACVIGGGEIYKLALQHCDRLYVTHVMAEPDGDTVFPVIAENDWDPVSHEAVPAGEIDSAETLYVTYDRKKQG